MENGTKEISCGCKERLMQHLLDSAKEDGVNISKMSDGYHSFEDLYRHRAVLTAVLFTQNRALAWKSWKHFDGSSEPGWFIVGIHTPEGEATYHYEEKYWDMFNVPIREYAPEWDGHTPDDALVRLMSLVNL